MPIIINIRENLFFREVFEEGKHECHQENRQEEAVALLCRQLEHRFGPLPASALLEVPLDNDRRVRTRVLSGPAQPWTRGRGRLAGTQTLQTHVVDHVDEVRRERLS